MGHGPLGSRARRGPSTMQEVVACLDLGKAKAVSWTGVPES